MLNCVIIDDEHQCTDVLAIMIRKKFADRLVITGTAMDAESGLALIRASVPDLVFLDVEMPGCSGLQLLSQFPQRDFCVVFTTAYDRYALDAIKTEAVDYLLKPISLQELTAAIEKADKLATLKLEAKTKTSQPQKILLPSGKGSVLVDVIEITHIEAENNYSTVYFMHRPKMVIARTLKIFDDQLSHRRFFRIHQSHLINLQHLKSYQGGDPGYAILSDGAKLEIARRRRVEFLKAIGDL